MTKHLFAGFILLGLAAFFDLVTMAGRNGVALSMASLFAIAAMFCFGRACQDARSTPVRVAIGVLFVPCLLVIGNVVYRVLR
jgi:hypothetical protein